jgi:class 3 adenylate cyclase
LGRHGKHSRPHEGACEPGRVNVSGTVYETVRDEFGWQHRGKIATKNKVEMEMYYVFDG